MIPQMEPWFDEAEADALALYMQSGGWLTEHTKTQELEELIAAYVGSRHCVMMPNGTMALYAMMSVLSIGPGDEVIVPDITMIATANAVRMVGAMPVFVDISEDTLCLDFELAQKAAGDKTAAILLVSLNGRCPDMGAFNILASCLGVPLLEDACQSLGSTWQGEHLGTVGLAGVFSFSSQKIISTGNGGCVVTDDDDVARKLRLFKNFGREGGTDDYQTFGTNLKFTDLQAVVGIEQMKKLPWRTKRKRAMYALYCQLLGLDSVRFIPTNLEGVCPWFVDVLVEDRENLMVFLRERGISTRPMYPALRRTPIYGHTGGPDWVSDYVAAHGLWLPSSLNLSVGDIHAVCSAIKEFYGA